MSDKQIIIDRVDVSEWTDEEIRYNFEKHSPKAIRQIAFDLYKQLKRKEQEREELKKQRQADKGLITSTGKQNYQLIQEYDKLKTDKAEALEQLEFVRTLNTIREAESRKLKQTLTKIEEIAMCIMDDDLEESSAYYDARRILQKISEVIPNEN